MFSFMTYEKILSDLLARVPDTVDKRQGSIIYDALAPIAVQLAETYIDLDLAVDESFADTSSRPYLIKRCAERGIYPLPATNAIVRMEFNIDVPIGSRFSFEKWNFRVDEKISTGVYKAVCEETGPVFGSGTAIPIEFIEGLKTAKVVEVLINGEYEEDTEELRARYFRSFNAQAYGGNRADYKEKVPQLQDVGAIRVKRIKEFDRNVRLTVLNSTFDGATEELVRAVQESVDPTYGQGEGYGIAPIGHHVIVNGVTLKKVDVATHITCTSSYTFEDLKGAIEEVLKKYYVELNKTWGDLDEDTQGLIVRISQIESRILELDGVMDIKDTTLNGVAENLVLDFGEIASLGGVTNA